MPFEGVHPLAIRGILGKKLRFLPSSSPITCSLSAGQWTDDTKMMLCHLDSILETGKIAPDDVAKRFIEWYSSGDLRGIGITTAQAIGHLMRGASWRESGVQGEYAAGNGAAMRIAPVGLYFAFLNVDMYPAVYDMSIITHNNKEAVAGAYAVAYGVARAAVGEFDVERTIDEIVEKLSGTITGSRIRRAADMAFDESITNERAVEFIGCGGYVAESVPLAFFAFLRFEKDFDNMMLALLGSGGDTDTNAAIAGALFGARYGVEELPSELVASVERGDEISRKAEELYRMALLRKR
jgi:ADP-ribosylglycohydrolase